MASLRSIFVYEYWVLLLAFLFLYAKKRDIENANLSCKPALSSKLSLPCHDLLCHALIVLLDAPGYRACLNIISYIIYLYQFQQQHQQQYCFLRRRVIEHE